VLSQGVRLCQSDDLRFWSANQRAAHYVDEAAKYRELAASEPNPVVQAQLLALAAQYQALAEGLLHSPG
jgi:hypothetical protein